MDRYVIPTTLCIGMFLTACLEHKISDLNVTNGEEIDDRIYPSVVKIIHRVNELEFICTGVFIHQSWILTAAHCVDEFEDSKPDIYVEFLDKMHGVYRQKALSYEQHPLYIPNTKLNENDLALIRIDSNRSIKISKISENKASIGGLVTLVGFGNNANFYAEDSLSGSGAGEKRIGKNKIYTLLKSGIIIVNGTDGLNFSPATKGLDSATGIGDSGGGLFVGGELLGVTIAGGLVKDNKTDKYRAISYFADLSSSPNHDFVQKILNH